MTAQHKPPMHITGKTKSVPGHPGVAGPAETLRAAFEAGTPVTLDGAYKGERVYLGHTRQTYGDYGITLETIGLDRDLGETSKFPGVRIAVYLVDLKRLELAPQLEAKLRDVEAKRAQRAWEIEQGHPGSSEPASAGECDNCGAETESRWIRYDSSGIKGAVCVRCNKEDGQLLIFA
ncbi:hypothetical protein [Streptomyces luteireticuli]|uniref:Uncharacterized protein n=1 Tax=Streptomyces luteireticuli TaxID=173858 RepID=A0ABN0YQT4_9ACTN